MDDVTLMLPAGDAPESEPQPTPVVPGVHCARLLAGRPDTWRGTSDGGRAVDVTVIRLSPEPAVRAAGLAAVAGLARLTVPGMPAVLGVEPARAGVAVIATAVDGSAVADLARLPPRTVAQAGLTLAGALGALHRSGRVLGADTNQLSKEVLQASDGSVWLCWHGLVSRRLAGSVASRSPAGDVTAARALLRKFVTADTERSARRLAVALEPRVRTADELARNLRKAARGQPLRSAGSGRPHRSGGQARPGRPIVRGVSSRGMRRRGRRRNWLVAGCAVAAAATVGVGWLAARSGLGATTLASPRPTGDVTVTGRPSVSAASSAAALSRSPSPDSAARPGGSFAADAVVTSVPGSPASTCAAALPRLEAARAKAFEGRGPLTDADLMGGAAYAADAITVTELQSAALHSNGPVPDVLASSVGSATASLCQLDVTDLLPAYSYLDSAGQVVATAPARGPRRWQIVLVLAGAAGWRIASVTAVS